MPSNRRSPSHRQREDVPKPNPGRHSTLLTSRPADQPTAPSDPATHPPVEHTNGNGIRPASGTQHPSPRNNGHRVSANGIRPASLVGATAVQAPPPQEAYKLSEADIHQMWNAPEPGLPLTPLQPSSFHSLRQITTHRSRNGLWTTLVFVAVAAAITVGVLLFLNDSEPGQTEIRAAVTNAASVAAGSVEDSLITLESLRAGSSFTPEHVSSISALGAASRSLVESAAALPTNEPSLAALRMSATALAGRVSRLGETFGAAFSYRGQVEPQLTPPSLNGPLEISNLSENAALLTDWQFRLDQAIATPPNHPRLLQNQQAIKATLPYVAVHRQAYSDAVGSGQPEQATVAMSQIFSLLTAVRQDFERAFNEIDEMTEREIQSLTSDLQSLSEGT